MKLNVLIIFFFALEIGTYSSQIIQGFAKQLTKIKESIKRLNNTYGKKDYWTVWIYGQFEKS